MPVSASNPLRDLHQQAEAEFQNYAGTEIVSTFGEPQAEYGAIRKACGMIDLPQRGCIELRGNDRLPFLNNLLTNQTWDKQSKTGLTSGASAYAFLLQARSGKIIADMNVIELGDRTLLEIDRRLTETVLATLDRYKFSEAVEFVDRSAELHRIGLHGPGAPAIAAPLIDVGTWAFRNDICGVPGFGLVLPVEAAHKLWMRLLTEFAAGPEIGKRPLRPVGWAAFNTARIEAGTALFGIDFDENFLPAEAGTFAMQRAVSFTKGCYPGQEIVARMHARQQLARQVVGFRIDDRALPLAGAQAFDTDGATIVGAVTSSTLSPVLSNASIGLAIVKRSHVSLGAELKIGAEGAMHVARVVELPFYKSEEPK